MSSLTLSGVSPYALDLRRSMSSFSIAFSMFAAFRAFASRLSSRRSSFFFIGISFGLSSDCQGRNRVFHNWHSLIGQLHLPRLDQVLSNLRHTLLTPVYHVIRPVQ